MERCFVLRWEKDAVDGFGKRRPAYAMPNPISVTAHLASAKVFFSEEELEAFKKENCLEHFYKEEVQPESLVKSIKYALAERKAQAKMDFERAIREAVRAGLPYEDLCTVLADTLNQISKEVHEASKSPEGASTI